MKARCHHAAMAVALTALLIAVGAPMSAKASPQVDRESSRISRSGRSATIFPTGSS